jgi:hypothetical protein
MRSPRCRFEAGGAAHARGLKAAPARRKRRRVRRYRLPLRQTPVKLGDFRLSTRGGLTCHELLSADPRRARAAGRLTRAVRGRRALDRDLS